jgi:hypothetical protein
MKAIIIKRSFNLNGTNYQRGQLVEITQDIYDKHSEEFSLINPTVEEKNYSLQYNKKRLRKKNGDE